MYARGKSYVNQALVLYVLKTRGKKTRVGLTATKKIGHAVQRNRARRVMKAAIDEHLDYNIGGYDLVFVARGMTPRLKSWQLSSVVAKLFAQAGLPDKAKRPDAPFFRLSLGTGDRSKLLRALKPRCDALHTRFDVYALRNEDYRGFTD